MIKLHTLLILLCFTSNLAYAINPLFTTYFLYVRHSLERQTWCRSYSEPTMINFIKNTNSFFEVVDLDRHGLNNTIRFLREYACTPDSDKNFTVTSVNISRLSMSKEVRCTTMYNILDILYDELREVSLLTSNRSFDPMQLKYLSDKEPTIKEIRDNLDKDKRLDTPFHEFFVALWITSGIYYEEMCEITRPIIEHLEFLLSNKLGRSLEITEKVPTKCDKFNVNAEVILAFVPRIYLDFKARLGEFWLTLKSGMENLVKLTLIQLMKTIDQGLQNFGYNFTQIPMSTKYQELIKELRQLKQPYLNLNVTLF